MAGKDAAALLRIYEAAHARETHTAERAAVAREEDVRVQTPPGQGKKQQIRSLQAKKLEKPQKLKFFGLFAATRKGEEKQKVVGLEEKCVEEGRRK